MTNNPDLIHQHSFTRLLLFRPEYDSPALRAVLKNPEAYLRQPIRYFKNNPGDSSTVALIKIDGMLMVIKRYNVKSFLHGIKLWFRNSRAMISWNNAFLLVQLEVPTIEPVAVLENRFGPLRSSAYLIYKYIEGVNLSDYFAHHAAEKDRFYAMVCSVAEIIKRLKSASITHADLHHSNLIVVDEKPLLLDLDHLKQHRFFKRRFQVAHKKDVEQFIEYLGANRNAIDLFRGVLGDEGPIRPLNNGKPL